MIANTWARPVESKVLGQPHFSSSALNSTQTLSSSSDCLRSLLLTVPCGQNMVLTLPLLSDGTLTNGLSGSVTVPRLPFSPWPHLCSQRQYMWETLAHHSTHYSMNLLCYFEQLLDHNLYVWTLRNKSLKISPKYCFLLGNTSYMLVLTDQYLKSQWSNKMLHFQRFKWTIWMVPVEALRDSSFSFKLNKSGLYCLHSYLPRSSTVLPNISCFFPRKQSKA